MRARPLLALGLAALLLTACGPSSSVAAEVGGREIAVADVERSALLYSLLGELNGQGCGNPAAGEAAAAACDRFTLSNLIQEEIVSRYATEHGVAVAAGDAESAVADLETSLGSDLLQQKLDTYGLDRSELVSLADRLLLFSEVRDDLAASITEEDLRAAYDASLDYTTIDTKHVLVEDEATAQDIAARATPENFGELAARYSIDPGSKDNGGALGPLTASSLVPEYAQAAIALRPGEISAPVQSQFGWHVILLVGIERTPFDRAEKELRLTLSSETYGNWLQAEYARLAIDVNPRFGRIDLTTGEVRPLRTTAATDSPSP